MYYVQEVTSGRVVGFPGLRLPSFFKKIYDGVMVSSAVHIMLVGALCFSQCWVKASDAMYDGWVRCLCYGDCNGGIDKPDNEHHHVPAVWSLWISRLDWYFVNGLMTLLNTMMLAFDFVQKERAQCGQSTWFISSSLFTQVGSLSTCAGTFIVEHCGPFSHTWPILLFCHWQCTVLVTASTAFLVLSHTQTDHRGTAALHTRRYSLQ